MSSQSEADDRVYAVVVNHEEQYSIWLADRPLAPGWREAGKRGGRDECLAHVAAVWTDLRPRSLRERQERATHE